VNLLFASAVGIRAKCQCCRLVFQHITRRELRSHVLEEASQVGVIFRLNNGKFKMIRSRLLFLLSLGQSIRAGRSLKKWTRLWDLLLSLNQQTWVSRAVGFIVLLKQMPFHIISPYKYLSWPIALSGSGWHIGLG